MCHLFLRLGIPHNPLAHPKNTWVSRSEMPVGVLLSSSLHLAPWKQFVDLLQSRMKDLLGGQLKSTNPQSPSQKSNQVPPIANGASPPQLYRWNKEAWRAASWVKTLGSEVCLWGFRTRKAHGVCSQFLKLRTGLAANMGHRVEEWLSEELSSESIKQ